MTLFFSIRSQMTLGFVPPPPPNYPTTNIPTSNYVPPPPRPEEPVIVPQNIDVQGYLTVNI